MEFSSPEEEYYYYNTAPAAVPIPPLTPYQQYLQSRGLFDPDSRVKSFSILHTIDCMNYTE